MQDFRILFAETADTITIHDIGPRGGFTTEERQMPVMTKTPKGDDIVILSRKDYDRLIAAANGDAADAMTLRRSIARIKSGEEYTLTSAEVDELLASKTPLAFYRKRAGSTQAALAERAGIAQGFVSEIEAGRKSGDVQTLRKIAELLKISLDDLVVPEASVEKPRKRKGHEPMKIPTADADNRRRRVVTPDSPEDAAVLDEVNRGASARSSGGL